MNCSLSPTATLYELGLEGMADQKPVELVPMVTVVVAALSVRAEMSSVDASSAASAERMTSAKRKDRMRSVGVCGARMPCPPWPQKLRAPGLLRKHATEAATGSLLPINIRT